MAAAEMVEPPPANRYAKMATAEELELWDQTFRMFDKDGGGDVDLRELGLMFRQLGQAPSEREMRLLIEEVDADRSGTIDYEEFCCLMLRQARATRTPEWLLDLLPPDLDEEAHAEMPTTAVLSDPKFEAAKTIQRRLKQKKLASESLPGGGGTFGAPLPPPPKANKPQQVEELSRDLMLMVVDLLPSASHITTAHLGGHGPLFGPFVAGELSWRLGTSTRTRLAYLDLAFNAIGDEGAAALARTLRQNKHLLNLDLSGNDIGQRGANALMASLCMQQEGGGKPPLRVLTLDDNRLSAEMNATLQTQLLLNNLPLALAETIRKADGQNKAKEVKLSLAAAAAANADPSVDEAVVGMELGELPSCRMSEEWLSQTHAPQMRGQLAEARVRSLHLHACPRFADAALHSLLLAPAPPAAGSQQHALRLLRLRVSSSAAVGDGVAASIAACINQGGPCLANLKGLALDDCALSLDKPAPPTLAPGLMRGGPGGSSAAHALGAALRRLPKLEQLDLNHNILLRDEAASALCAALLAAEPPEGCTHASSLRLLHLGGTGAGNGAACACADALAAGKSALAVLCVSGECGDVGAKALAAVLTEDCPLRELYLGNKVGDMGLEKLAAALGDKVGELTAEEDLRRPKSQLEVLGLGGLVRGGVTLHNRLEPASGRLLAEAFRHNPEGKLRELRLSGNSAIGGPALLGLASSLLSVSNLKALHIEGCGLTKGEVGTLVETMHEVWCLHELILDRSPAEPKVPCAASMLAPEHAAGGHAAAAPSGAPPGGVSAKGKKGGGGGGGGKLLGLKQRMGLGKILEDNRKMGPRRVESWRLSKSLEEVQWVFTSLCAAMPKETVDGGVASWSGEACGLFASNLGLPQYRASFEFNLTGASLASLRMAELSQLGVKSHSEQKQVMSAVRSLLHAYERRERVAHANALWSGLLGGGGLVEKMQAQVAKEQAEEAAALYSLSAEEEEEQDAARAKAEAEAKRLLEKPVLQMRRAPVGKPEQPPYLGVHSFERTLSPSRKGANGSAQELKVQRAQRTMPGRRGRGGGLTREPLPMIHQKAGVQAVGAWPKKAASKSSFNYQTAAAHAPVARQQNFAVAGSQLHSDTRELFRGLMHTLETFPGGGGGGGVAIMPPSPGGAMPALAAGGSMGALRGGGHGATASSKALHGACESVIATRYCGGPGACGGSEQGMARSCSSGALGPRTSSQRRTAASTMASSTSVASMPTTWSQGGGASAPLMTATAGAPAAELTVAGARLPTSDERLASIYSDIKREALMGAEAGAPVSAPVMPPSPPPRG